MDWFRQHPGDARPPLESAPGISSPALNDLKQWLTQANVLQDAQGKLNPNKIVGFPNDATKALLGNGLWGTTAVAPSHLPGMGSDSIQLTVTANTAYLMPIGNVITTTPITRISWGLQAVVAGNYDVGIYYSDDESTFTRLASKGSTAIPAAGNVITTISTATISPVVGRRWYYALAMSTASGVAAASHNVGLAGGIPGYSKATSFALPSSLTGMTAIGAGSLPVLHGAV